MPENNAPEVVTRRLLSEIVEYEDGLRQRLGKMKFYTHLAKQLSNLAGHKPALGLALCTECTPRDG